VRWLDITRWGQVTHMAAISAKVAERLRNGLKEFQGVLETARQRDINEADTVTIIKDMLAEVWGFDKYTELTSEHAIRGTYCDLAIHIEGQPVLLIEVKAIGVGLKDQHTKQAVDYASNKGIEWVALTNGSRWHLYRVQFTKPINAELVVEFDLLSLNPRDPSALDTLYVLSREGMQKSALEQYLTQRQATDRFLIAAVVLTDPVLQVIRRELRRANTGVLVEADEIRAVLTSEVLKREVVDGDKAAEATRRIARAGSTALRARRKPEEVAPDEPGTAAPGPASSVDAGA